MYIQIKKIYKNIIHVLVYKLLIKKKPKVQVSYSDHVPSVVRP